MYDDLRHVRKHAHKINFNDEEQAAFEDSVRRFGSGKQRAVLLREMVMATIHALNDGVIDRDLEGANEGLEKARVSRGNR